MVFTITHISLICEVSMCHPDAYSEPYQTFKMKRFVKIVRRLALNYFCKTLHFRYLRGFWIQLCHLRHKFSICILNHVQREHIQMNVWRFSLKDSSVEGFLFVHEILSLLLNEFLQSEIMQKSRAVQNITHIIAVPPDSVVQINNFFSLLIFSAVIHKRREQKLICKSTKYKLDSSSKMRFAFFLNLKAIQSLFFGKLAICSKIWKWHK